VPDRSVKYTDGLVSEPTLGQTAAMDKRSPGLPTPAAAVPDGPAPASSPEPPAPVAIAPQDGIVVITIQRPPHNLLTEPDLRAIADALHEPVPGARAMVLHSVGRSFCAGANFRSDDAPDPTDAGAFATRTSAFYAQAERVFAAPLPTVAAVHGAAIGAGFGLAMACDIRVVGEAAWFQANFVALGIHPGFALSTTVPWAVGSGRAADVLLTGRRVAADEAVRIGLAQRLVPAGAELAAAMEIAAAIAAGAPLATRATRATLRAGLAEEAARAMAHELQEQCRLAGTADAKEGVQAMLDKRAPRFEDR
jgi:enoyl-CoA hydratase/carnithine racemase